MNVKKIVVSTAATAALLFAGGTAAEAQYIGGGSGGATTTTTISTPGSEIPIVTVVRGERVDMTGKGCGAGATVDITIETGGSLGTATAGSDGTFVASVLIPLSTSLGEHLLTATCAGPAGPPARATMPVALPSAGSARPFGRAAAPASPIQTAKPVLQYLRINVIDRANGSNGSGALARTGSDTAPLVGIGAAALVLGGAFVYGARRPRTA